MKKTFAALFFYYYRQKIQSFLLSSRKKVMKEEQIIIILNALKSAQDYLYDNLEAICDDNYRDETQRVLDEIEQAINMANSIFPTL